MGISVSHDLQESISAEGVPVSARWLAAERQLVQLARTESALKLRAGELLDALFLRKGHHELGFSSIDAYVVERCQRSAAWGREARALARRIREGALFGLRAAVRSGELGSAKAELVARFATVDTEVSLLARAKESTFRALAAELTGATGDLTAGEDAAPEKVSAIEWVRPQDLAAVTASRMLVEYLTNGARSDEAFVEALLGEGQGALLTLAEKRAASGARDDQTSADAVDARLARALGAIAGRRDVGVGFEATVAVDARTAPAAAAPAGAAPAAAAPAGAAPAGAAPFPEDAPSDAGGAVGRRRRDPGTFSSRWGRGDFGSGRGPHRSFGAGRGAASTGPALDALMARAKVWLAALDEDEPLPSTVRGLDVAIVDLCRALAGRSVVLARLLSSVARSQIWRALGFEDVATWARERLGLSRSSVEHRETLVKRLDRCAVLARAVETGAIGYEPALLVSRLVDRDAALAEAWIDRATRRTYKHLREEVRAVELARAYDPEVSPYPPSEEDLEAVAAFERTVQSGEIMRPYSVTAVPSPATTVELSASAPDVDTRPAARPLRLHISTDLFAEWRRVEANYLALGGERRTFVGFLCATLWETWLPFLETWDDKWRSVFVRDLHRCTSPVCERHDVTAHHVRFRAHGGSDDLDNMTSGCTFCHLEGIHRRRLKAEGRAPGLTWHIGRDPILEVRGREKIELYPTRYGASAPDASSAPGRPWMVA
ncbi:HNH endonuclease [Myxococcota bacterium]|nr:HNH endonuclease [Myxococcota bacterium]